LRWDERALLVVDGMKLTWLYFMLVIWLFVCWRGGGFGRQRCTSRNIHGWDEASLERMMKDWEPTPQHMTMMKVQVRGGLG
jgi:hypothetical protein